MLGFIQKYCFTGLAFLLTLKDANLLSYISMNNQVCRIRLQIVNINSKEFFSLVFKQVYAVVVATISIIHM